MLHFTSSYTAKHYCIPGLCNPAAYAENFKTKCRCKNVKRSPEIIEARYDAKEGLATRIFYKTQRIVKGHCGSRIRKNERCRVQLDYRYIANY